MSTPLLGLLALACVGAAAAAQSGAAAPPAGAKQAAAAAPPAVFQLDVCNQHRSVSQAPASTLTVTPDGTCIVSSQVISGGASACGVSGGDAAMQLRFACKAEPRQMKAASGPALNVWASTAGVPRPSKAGLVVSEAAPKPGGKLTPSSAARNASSNSNSSSSDAAGCHFLTLNPGLYYHRVPPMVHYGYEVSGVPCQRAAAPAVQVVTEKAAKVRVVSEAGAPDGGRTVATSYSLWLKPSLPPPPASMSTEAQACHIVVALADKSYVSLQQFPCAMRTLQPEQLGQGCCFDPSSQGSGRHLLQAWDRVASYRRALLL